jgi:CRP-like cAMP-binding protein
MNTTKLQKFFNQFPEITYIKGEKILRPHEDTKQVYYITNGYVRIYKVLKSGQEITYNWFNPSLKTELILGITPLISEIHVDAYVDVTIRRAPVDQFRKFLHENPDVYEIIIKQMMMLFSESVKQVEWLSIPDANTRLKLMLHTFALVQREYKKQHNQDGQIAMKLTHHLLASFSGLTRETVTIQLKKLMEQGYISRLEGVIIIENTDKLIKDIQ